MHPGDARHLPRKGLVHIVNELACRGLCDPLLPGTFGDSNKYGDLSAMADQIEVSTREFNDLNNWRTSPPVSDIQRRQQAQVAAESLLTSLVIKTVPVDELSIANAMEELKSLSGSGWGYQRDFFERLQVKVPYGEWPQYLTMISHQGQLELHEKLRILSACKEAWSKASNTVASTLTGCAEIIIRQHVSDFVSFDYLSISDMGAVGPTCLGLFSCVARFGAKRPNAMKEIVRVELACYAGPT